MDIPLENRTLWVDLDNTPHVPFFQPIVQALKQQKWQVLLTARDAFQVCDLADHHGLSYHKVGKHHGANPIFKLFGLFCRALQLAPLVRAHRPVLAISHGSRAQLILCNILGTPAVLIDDYEHSRYLPLMKPAWQIVPSSIPVENLPCPPHRVRTYPGTKEDVYAHLLQPDASILQELGIADAHIRVTVRPPASEAHYHNPESEVLFASFMDLACRQDDLRIVLLPRNEKQAQRIRSQWPAWFEKNRTVIPKRALDGLNLIWHSDLVVSGGGTMNREAAALGVPVYSIFRGPIGAVDRELSRQGRLMLVASVADVATSIKLEKRPRKPLAEMARRETLDCLVKTLGEIAESTVTAKS